MLQGCAAGRSFPSAHTHMLPGQLRASKVLFVFLFSMKRPIKPKFRKRSPTLKWIYAGMKGEKNHLIMQVLSLQVKTAVFPKKVCSKWLSP